MHPPSFSSLSSSSSSSHLRKGSEFGELIELSFLSRASLIKHWPNAKRIYLELRLCDLCVSLDWSKDIEKVGVEFWFVFYSRSDSQNNEHLFWTETHWENISSFCLNDGNQAMSHFPSFSSAHLCWPLNRWSMRMLGAHRLNRFQPLICMTRWNRSEAFLQKTFQV